MTLSTWLRDYLYFPLGGPGSVRFGPTGTSGSPCSYAVYGTEPIGPSCSTVPSTPLRWSSIAISIDAQAQQRYGGPTYDLCSLK